MEKTLTIENIFKEKQKELLKKIDLENSIDIAQLKTIAGVDLYVFDGNGYLHPRHMGLATHAGILLNKPSIGVAKTYFKVENCEYILPQYILVCKVVQRILSLRNIL